jgi:hypothetical protein
MRAQIELAMQQAAAQQQAQAANGQQPRSSIVEEKTVDLEVGTKGAKTKAIRIIAEDDKKKRIVEEFVILTPFDNEFGYLVIFAAGPDTAFDDKGFQEFLRTIDMKPTPGATQASTPPTATNAPPASTNTSTPPVDKDENK